jgi:probable HAF family extracellular repeat protein
MVGLEATGLQGYTQATGINDAGVIAGSGYVNPDTYSQPFDTFVDIGGNYTLVSNPGGTVSAQGINSAGTVVGGYALNYGNAVWYPFTYSNGTFTSLGPFGQAGVTYGLAINDAGAIVGYYSDPNTNQGIPHAFIYSNSTYSDLGSLPGGSHANAEAINNSGVIVGYSSTASSENHAVVISNGAMTDLNSVLSQPLSTALSNATAISDLGQIVALGVDGSTYLLTPIPPVATTTALNSSSNPALLGKSVVFTATVTANSGSNTPTGTLAFIVGGATVFTTTLGSGGTATYTTSKLALGITDMQAAFAGNANFVASSADVQQTVNLPVAIAPKFTPAAGAYGKAETVKLSSSTPAATIYFTTNGNPPSMSSTKYTGPIAVNATETIQAIATASGYTASPVANATYELFGSPQVFTGLATAISTAKATINATVNDSGASAQAWFVWGKTSNDLGSTTSKITLTGSVAAQSAGIPLTKLKSKTTYYFQPIANSIGGKSYGAIQSFTTE